MLRLQNPRQGYDWGSAVDIPRFAGEQGDNSPVAEEWMGTHPLGESVAVDPSGTQTPLSQVAGRLPFMMKLLAAARPLSVQVHPSAEQAASGFAADEAAGLALDDPKRTYKDPHHKPEMVYAITTFDTLVGFRPTAEILRVLQGLDLPVTRRMHDDLAADPGFAGIVRLVEDLLTEGQPADVIHDVVAQCRRLVDENIDIKRAYTTVVDIAEDHPDDVGLLVSLLLNRLTLQPGEAAFLADGIIHAHMRGLCVEVMAASDNVLRGGLTSKFVNPPELVRSLDAGMSRLARVTPELLGTSTELFSPNVEEFALAVAQCSTGQSEGVELPDSEHRIVVCTGGEVEVVNGSGETLVLKRGESMYAGDADGTLTIHGLGEVAQAFLPSSNLRGRLIDLV